MTQLDFHQFCREQVLRMGACAGFPDLKTETGPAAVRELIHTLEFRVSRGDRDLARKVVDLALENSRFCPAPADLIAIGSDLREQERTGPKQGFPGCEACSFSGWVYVEDGGQGSARVCACRKVAR